MIYQRVIPQKLNMMEALKAMSDRFVKNDYAEITGTHLLGVMVVSYENLVKIFGEPVLFDEDESDKVDAEWVIEVLNPETGAKEDVLTIYNWKDGKAYCGESGLDVQEITNWHVGGRKESLWYELKAFVEEAINVTLVKTEGAGTW